MAVRVIIKALGCRPRDATINENKDDERRTRTISSAGSGCGLVRGHARAACDHGVDALCALPGGSGGWRSAAGSAAAGRGVVESAISGAADSGITTARGDDGARSSLSRQRDRRDDRLRRQPVDIVLVVRADMYRTTRNRRVEGT